MWHGNFMDGSQDNSLVFLSIPGRSDINKNKNKV